jgi:hypothetical protein
MTEVVFCFTTGHAAYFCTNEKPVHPVVIGRSEEKKKEVIPTPSSSSLLPPTFRPSSLALALVTLAATKCCYLDG